MKLLLVSIIYLLTFTHSCSQDGTDKNTITIIDGGRAKQEMMYLNKEHWTMMLIIKENTLNDTARIGGVLHIPPGQLGTLMKGDCFMDSMLFSYQPYKATKGRLVVEYTSLPY
jgi:hypothetical protein